jgi:hypothetical protein
VGVRPPVAEFIFRIWISGAKKCPPLSCETTGEGVVWDSASHFSDLLVNFAAMFTRPSFDNFVMLATGWIACVGRRQISRVIRFGSILGVGKQHAALYRFFSRARWSTDGLGEAVFRLALRHIPSGERITWVVDDTLCAKGGAHIWGCGMYHDLHRSSYSGTGRTMPFFTFGHTWVILCVCLALPWNADRVIAIPIAVRLYRSKKRCPPESYKKRTELAREMVHMASRWLPPGRRVVLTGDTEYACRVVVRDLPDQVDFVGPMHMDAALYDRPGPGPVRGRKRLKGERLPSPNQLIRSRKVRWKRREVVLYGRTVEVLIKSQKCLWYRVAKTRLLQMIVTRDPSGRVEDRTYFSTDTRMGLGTIAHVFSKRWSQEVMHRNVKQHLGLEDPQNGWWRRPAGKRLKKKVAGPQPHKVRGELAAERTVPFILTTYALVVLWYFENGSYQRDVARARRWAPWYGHKYEPSFADMLASLRRHIIASGNLRYPPSHAGSSKLDDPLVEWLCSA